MVRSSASCRHPEGFLSALFERNAAYDKHASKDLAYLLECIVDLQETLKDGVEVSSEQFAAVLDFTARRDALSLSGLATEFSVDRSTATRWRQGHNSPHPLVRKMVLAWIEQEIIKRIRTLDPEGSISLIKTDKTKTDTLDDETTTKTTTTAELVVSN